MDKCVDWERQDEVRERVYEDPGEPIGSERGKENPDDLEGCRIRVLSRTLV